MTQLSPTQPPATPGCCHINIVMVRHGESEWNLKNLFCGWYDSQLSETGIKEAKAAGKALKDAGYKFDLAYTSMLTRAQKTLENILKEQGQTDLLVEKTWRLNERHYGALTGLNKVETVEQYGEEQVTIWRRSFDIPPPPMEEDHPYYAKIRLDPRYNVNGPLPDEFPKAESLQLTIERTMPFWNGTIVPKLKSGAKILIVAHGNSLRGIVKYMDRISDADIVELNLPTGIPFVYTLNKTKNFDPVDGKSMQFLGDPETVKMAMEKVANQTKKK